MLCCGVILHTSRALHLISGSVGNLLHFCCIMGALGRSSPGANWHCPANTDRVGLVYTRQVSGPEVKAIGMTPSDVSRKKPLL